MGCAKSNLKDIYNICIPKKKIFNKKIEIYEFDYLSYCNKCDFLGTDKTITHCDICNRCHNVLKYIHCTKCNLCLNPHSDRDIIIHRKVHKNIKNI